MLNVANVNIIFVFNYLIFFLTFVLFNLITVCFKIFDIDRDGVLNEIEVKQMIEILIFIANESTNAKNTQHRTCDEFIIELKNRKTKQADVNCSLESEGKICKNEIGEMQSADLTQEDFLMWNIENSFHLVQPFLDLLFETCHIVLGLRPQCRHLEHDIGKYRFFILSSIL